MKLAGKTIVVTGASGEIGRAVSLELANAGAKLILHYNSDAGSAEELRKATTAAGSQSLTCAADLSSFAEATKLMEFAKASFGDISALVCLSGSLVGGGSIDNASEADWKKALDANLMTVVNAIHAAIPHLSDEGSRIVVTSSVRGLPLGGRETAIAYAAAKAALITLAATVAKQLGPKTLVNSISPGFVWTSNYEQLDPSMYEAFISQTILNRFITAAEIAPTYRFLCETDVMTGQNLVVDGGFSLKL